MCYGEVETLRAGKMGPLETAAGGVCGHAFKATNPEFVTTIGWAKQVLLMVLP